MITILDQHPGTHPKLHKIKKYPIISKPYKINFFRIFSLFFLPSIGITFYITMGQKLRALKQQW